MAKSRKNGEKKARRERRGADKSAKLAKKDKLPIAKVNAIQPESPHSRITRPFVLIGQIIWVLADVSTLLLRMLVYTLVYDTPHGKHEMMLDTRGSNEQQ